MPLAILSSCLTYAGTVDPLPAGGPNNHVHHLPPSDSDPSDSLPFPFLLPRPFDLDLLIGSRSLSLGSRSGSANDTRFGVLRPEPMPTASEMLCQLLLSESAGDAGVGGAERPLRPFIADTRGGLGARVDVVCRARVKSRETLAVACEVSATGATVGGLRNSGRDSFGSLLRVFFAPSSRAGSPFDFSEGLTPPFRDEAAEAWDTGA